MSPTWRLSSPPLCDTPRLVTVVSNAQCMAVSRNRVTRMVPTQVILTSHLYPRVTILSC